MAGHRIDVHGHCLGGPVGRWLDSATYFGKAAARIPRWTSEAALEFMDRHQIACQLLSLPLTFDDQLGGAVSASEFVEEVTDHLMFGTDWPAAPKSVIVDNTARLTGFDGFTSAQLHAIEYGNAASLFPRLVQHAPRAVEA